MMSSSAPPAPTPKKPWRDARALTERVFHIGQELREGLATRIVGLDRVVDHVLTALVTRQHTLLEGVPGLAKTLLLSSIAELLDLSFSRIQFTPDLMPSDVTGSEYLLQDPLTGERSFRFSKGPLFAHIVLADEINRAPPKTQAALMEAMEERQVTSLGKRHALDEPFVVLATQNPIEQEGTYELPFAQLDRFLFKVHLRYPSMDDEAEIARLSAREWPRRLSPIVQRDEFLQIVHGIGTLDIPSPVVRYSVELAQATRPGQPGASPSVAEYVEWGAGPRAAQALVIAARARACLHGRAVATIEDVRDVAPSVFRHRLVMTFAAQADDMTTDSVVQAMLREVGAPGRDMRPVAKESWLRRLWKSA